MRGYKSTVASARAIFPFLDFLPVAASKTRRALCPKNKLLCKMVHPVAFDSQPALDSSLRSTPSQAGDDIPIDPALFNVQEEVEGKERVQDEFESHQVHEIKEEEDEFDPALREIVNSLTNAQQVSLRPSRLAV